MFLGDFCRISFLSGNAAGGVDVAPEGGIDTIVSQALEEAGQHILRVEVGYGGSDGSVKTLRKFYRFQVTNPLTISELTTRTGDASCFVSISLENNAAETKGGSLTICGAEFDPAPGLSAEPIVATKALHMAPTDSATSRYPKATDLYDESGRLEAGSSVRYLFKVTATSEEAANRGIAAGDELGKAIFTWRKAMGEMGRMASSPILCPMATPYINPSDPVSTMTGGDGKNVVHMHGSGLSVDVATAAAKRAASTDPIPSKASSLENVLPVTVEPIDPPKRLHVGVPQPVQFLVVNHSNKDMALQLQFQFEHMGTELMVCGPSYINLGDIPGSGGSASATVRFLSLCAGLHRVQGCCIVDLNTEQRVPQPPLFSVLVEEPEQ